ncbi:MAG: hypothetical protein SFU27_14480, partial [Thermonemataceae bacterium]|nr:hypothetical protein [Thermonemataceae bacterium]
EEIDLLELILRVFSFFKRRLVLIISVLLVIGTTGIITNFLVFKPRYQSSMVLVSRSLSVSELIALFGGIQDLAKEGNHNELSQLTQVEAPVWADLASLKAEPNTELQKMSPKTTLKDFSVAITIEVLDNKNWKKIEQGLLNYLENTPYVKKKTALYKENQADLLKKVQKEIKRTDSLKSIIESSQTTKNQMIIGTSGDIYAASVELYEKENEIKENIAFAADIRLIKGFTNYQKPQKFTLKDTLLLWGGVGLFLGILIALLAELNMILKQRKDKK